VAIVTERQRDTATTQPAIGAKRRESVLLPLLRSPLQITLPRTTAGWRRERGLLPARSVAALLHPRTRFLGDLGDRPGWAWKWRYKRPKATLLAHAATYSRIAPSLPAFSCPPALDPSHIALFAGCLLVACRLLAGACWCLFDSRSGKLTLPFHPTPASATGPAINAISSALGPRRKIEIQLLTRFSLISRSLHRQLSCFK
jgi:hypothetical protein